jgi:GT2 family glycosyltransferase
MLKLTVAIPVFNQLHDTKAVWAEHLQNIVDKDAVEMLVIDNGCTDGTQEFLNRFIFSRFADHRMVSNPSNVGVLASMQQCWQEAKGDVIAILHNDLHVLEYGWDRRVRAEFEGDERLGLAGFLGAKRCEVDGGRGDTYSNMLEAELHGNRETGTKQVVVFDGMALIGRRKMFEDVGGFDQGYTYHHFYDRDISVASSVKGWVNKMIGVFCHHRSGITACRPEYNQWISEKLNAPNFSGDLMSYKASEQYFIHKWHGKLPVWVV